MECDLEEEDDWIVVKKQKITILVSPPSPSHQGSTKPNNKTEPMLVKSSAGAQRKRRYEFTKDDEHSEPSRQSSPIDPPPVVIGAISKPQEPSDPVSVPEKLNSPSLAKANGNKKSINALRPLSIGSQNFVNRRLRALNLERELERLGGLSTWLELRGLGRFTTIFEREKMGKYQIANLTTSKLKEMGTNAVGPRRKLIHAIHSLCHPYYYKALQ